MRADIAFDGSGGSGQKQELSWTRLIRLARVVDAIRLNPKSVLPVFQLSEWRSQRVALRTYVTGKYWLLHDFPSEPSVEPPPQVVPQRRASTSHD